MPEKGASAGIRGLTPIPARVTAQCWSCCSSSSIQIRLAGFPILHLLLGLVLADAVRVLDLADELVALAGDAVDVVVGELAPLLFHFALHLLPVAFDAIPVHACSFTVAYQQSAVIPTGSATRCRRLPMAAVARTTTLRRGGGGGKS